MCIRSTRMLGVRRHRLNSTAFATRLQRAIQTARPSSPDPFRDVAATSSVSRGRGCRRGRGRPRRPLLRSSMPVPRRTLRRGAGSQRDRRRAPMRWRTTNATGCATGAVDHPRSLGGPRCTSRDRRCRSRRHRSRRASSDNRSRSVRVRRGVVAGRGGTIGRVVGTRSRRWPNRRTRGPHGRGRTWGVDPLSVGRRTKAARGAPAETNNSTSKRATGSTEATRWSSSTVPG
jgi:hypothetical protein